MTWLSRYQVDWSMTVNFREGVIRLLGQILDILRLHQTQGLFTAQTWKLARADQTTWTRDGRVKPLDGHVGRCDHMEFEVVAEKAIGQIEQIANLVAAAGTARQQPFLGIFQ